MLFAAILHEARDPERILCRTQAGGSGHADLQWGDSEGGGHTVLRALTEPFPTPIFFIAPLAVGGQRAYYNFARQFLSWTKPHPLYSLDHDTLGTDLPGPGDPSRRCWC